jgi:hypothetical protein
MAQVGLGGAQAVPVGCGFDAAGVDERPLRAEVSRTRLGQDLPDHRLGLVVAALPEPLVAEPSVCVDEVEGRPVVVVEGTPDRELVVDRDGIVDRQGVRGAPHVVHVPLEAELR